jgi:hypothetical protein
MESWPSLDGILPGWSFGHAHSVEVAAGPDAAWRAVLDVRPAEVRLLGPLMAVRRLGARPPDAARDRPLLDVMCAGGFVPLAGSGREVVIGIVGRFWSLRPDMAALEGAAAFSAFTSPGWAKGVMAFRVTPTGPGRSRVETETRVAATSPDAHRRFARYWRLVHLGSALIRRSWLAAIRRRAEASCPTA